MFELLGVGWEEGGGAFCPIKGVPAGDGGPLSLCGEIPTPDKTTRGAPPRAGPRASQFFGRPQPGMPPAYLYNKCITRLAIIQSIPTHAWGG